MFFLGISAHLLVYLLVPAFLVVCFYFKGVAGNSEAIVLLPEMVVYEHCISVSTEKTYIYQIKKQKEIILKQQGNFPKYLGILQVYFTKLSLYQSPVFLNNTLRAPPISA